MALVDSIKGNGIEVKLMLPLISSTVSKLNLKEYQRNPSNITGGLISVVSINPAKRFLSFFDNFSSVISLKVPYSDIRLMMEN